MTPALVLQAIASAACFALAAWAVVLMKGGKP